MFKFKKSSKNKYKVTSILVCRVCRYFLFSLSWFIHERNRLLTKFILLPSSSATSKAVLPFSSLMF